MRLLPAAYLRQVCHDIFVACGAPSEEAAIVAGELVEASLCGLDSHGVMRCHQYVADVSRGRTRPGAPIRVVKETATTAIVDCGYNFGPVGAMRMVDIVHDKARAAQVACAVSRNSCHIGRLGAYVQRLAERDMFAIATCNSSKHGHWVVPWGGREGRLATNPLAYAAPTSGLPVVMDMSTSMISEGKIRLLLQQGKPVPEGYIQDAAGNPTTDPRAFYGSPHGTILPLGSALGYKGFGLALLVEILSGVMAGMTTSLEHDYVNGLALIAINPEAFCGLAQFKVLMDDLCSYVTSSSPAPGCEQVVMPGAYDFRTRDRRLREGIPVDDATWQLMVEAAESVGVHIGEPPH